MQRFERMRILFYEWSRALFVAVGHDIYCEGGFKPNYMTFYVYFLIGLFIISTIYTFIFYDWFTRLSGIVNLAVLLEVSDFIFHDIFFSTKLIEIFYHFLQILMKIYSIRYAHLIVELVDKLVDIFRINSKVSAHGRQVMLDRFLKYTEYLFKMALSLYVLASGGYFIYPFYRYKTADEMVPVMLSFLPFIDENTTSGYVILFVFHVNLIILGTLGTACSDLSFTMVIVNVPVLGNIFGDNIEDLNETLRDEHQNLRFIKARLMNILLQHREIFEWVMKFSSK